MKKIPIGIENFKELIDKDYYFMDKSMLIQNIMDEKINIVQLEVMIKILGKKNIYHDVLIGKEIKKIVEKS